MLEPLARLGYASKAFIYAIIGILAASAAINRGGGVTDTSGALKVILTKPFGNTLLFVLSAGLCGYALWRVLDAIFDPDRHGTDFGGLVSRIGSVVRAHSTGRSASKRSGSPGACAGPTAARRSCGRRASWTSPSAPGSSASPG